jgi:hypothetical protein
MSTEMWGFFAYGIICGWAACILRYRYQKMSTEIESEKAKKAKLVRGELSEAGYQRGSLSVLSFF